MGREKTPLGRQRVGSKLMLSTRLKPAPVLA
nr:MAG TPA: hypothetical protein [Caudoviricetes sp.]